MSWTAVPAATGTWASVPLITDASFTTGTFTAEAFDPTAFEVAGWVSPAPAPAPSPTWTPTVAAPIP